MTMIWNNPTTPEEAEAIIVMVLNSIDKWSSAELEEYCKKLALFAGSFNHVWTVSHRYQLINILANIGFPAIDPVLEALTDSPRAEQFDVTNSFIRRLVSTYRGEF
jgi:hypothetical protein